MVRIERIHPFHPLYPQECALREEVLLRPLGLSMEWWLRNYASVEDRSEHYLAAIKLPEGAGGGMKVAGCALLLPYEPGPRHGRLLQMAVSAQRQGEGLGRRLVASIESRAFGELHLDELYCHAQLKAESFYQRLGWEPVGEIFEEGGIPHRKMTIRCPAVEEELF